MREHSGNICAEIFLQFSTLRKNFEQMKITKNTSLQAYNTFGIDAKAASLVVISNEDELIQLLKQWKGSKPFILGGGSNILLTGNVEGLVIKNEIKGKDVQQQEDGKVLVKVGGR